MNNEYPASKTAPHAVAPDHAQARGENGHERDHEQMDRERSIARPEPQPLHPWPESAHSLVHTDLDSSTQSDACRAIRTALLGLAGQRSFITLVVGVTPRSGASFLARNLAKSFTFDGTRASLLVDCNLLRPAQHRALGVDPVEGGLVDFLQPEDPAQRGAPSIYPTDIPQLHLLPAGRQCKHDHEEHFSSPRMGDLLGFLQHRYPDRQLFLDGPCIQGSPDASILAQMADFVVLVVGYGRASPETIRRAALQFPASKRAGVVFNQMA